ncbi:hypothetical protein [Nostoc sp.]|uniref:hypothetical protein n=1 Tax=Nostoc sp. TaxID=1180 RepID=UPI002FF51E4F
MANSRTIPYGINERGLRALRKIEGLEAAVKATCVENHGSIIYQKNKILENRPKSKYSFNTDRTSLLIALLSQLTEKSDNKVEIYYDCKCTSADFENKTLTFEKVKETVPENQTEKFQVDYDLLIGADGARSIVQYLCQNKSLEKFWQNWQNYPYISVSLKK